MLVTSGSGGHFVDPVCDGERHLAAAPFARHAARLAAEEHRFGDALLLDTGGLLAPNGVARFAAAADPDALASMIASLGYEALAFGEAELGAPREAITRTLAALRARGVPVIASNLRCDAEAAALCATLLDAGDPPLTRDVGAARIALLAFLGPAALRRVAPENAGGLHLGEVGPSMALAVRAARARGADQVIALLDDGADAGASARAVTLAASLDPDDRPDLLISAGGGARILFARPAGFRPAIAAAPPGGAADIHIRRNEVSGTSDVLVQALDAAPEVPEAVRVFMERVGPRYCARWGDPLPGGRLRESMDADGLLRLAAGVMRVRSGAEVALVNRGVVDGSFRPARADVLTASDVFVGVQFDEPLVQARVPAAWLREVARRAAARPELLALGVTVEGAGTDKEKIQVNGRPLEPNGTYQVVTLRFLASGGDELLPEGPRWEPEADATLRGALLAYLESASDEDPRTRLPRFEDRPEWTLRWNAMATYGGSTVNNQGSYEDSQFEWQDTAAFGVDSTTRLDALARLWGWENTAIVRYQTARTGGGAFAEGSDLLSYRTHARWRGLRARRDAIYVPDLFAEAYLESELTRDSARGYHHLLLRPTAGLRWDLTPKLTVKTSGGFEWETLDRSADPAPGVGAQVVLQPLTLVESGDRHVIVELSADYFVSDLAGSNRQSIRGAANVVFALNRIFAIALTTNTYAVHESDNLWSVAHNVAAALRLGWVNRGTR